jgi:hypothetical protein
MTNEQEPRLLADRMEWPRWASIALVLVAIGAVVTVWATLNDIF